MNREWALTKLQNTNFYGIVDAGYVELENMEQAATELCQGGAGVVQLRAKGVEKEVVLTMAHKLIKICRQHEVVFVVNDYADIALAVSADALHIGQDDGGLETARDIVGSEMLVGRSTHSVEQAIGARDEGFDYIGFGPLFPTPTKKGRPGIGMENIATVESQVGAVIPVYCIGGVREDNLTSVINAGAKRVVIVSDVLTAADRVAKVQSIVSKLDK